MKKIISARLIFLCVAALAVGVFAGCSKNEAAETAKPVEKKDNRPTVRLVTDASGVNDHSFNASAWRGILAYYGDTWEAQKNRGTLYDNITCQTQDMYVPILRQVSDEAPDLIVTTGFTFADALTEVAQDYPNQKYMIVDVDWVDVPNVMNFAFREDEGSYLVGVVAALKAQEDGVENPKFGFIGGVPGATITKFEVGFIQGIRSVFPDAQIVDYYANAWDKPELAKTQAKNWFDSGVYAIFSAAGSTGGGTIAQAKEYRQQGKNVWAIGVDSDQYEDGIYAGAQSAVLTSMLKRVEASTQYALKELANGTFDGKVVNLDLAQAGVGFSTANPELGIDIINAAEVVKADIESGKIKIIPTYKDALAAGVVPAGLGAMDN